MLARLDRFYVNRKMMKEVLRTDIIYSGFSDHSQIVIVFRLTSHMGVGFFLVEIKYRYSQLYLLQRSLLCGVAGPCLQKREFC